MTAPPAMPFAAPRTLPPLTRRRLASEITLLDGASAGAPAPLVGPDRPAPGRPRSVAVVGNAPEVRRIGALVDRADWVFRFNNTHGLGGTTGRRLTHLFLMNFGNQTREWLDDPAFHRRPAIARAQHVVLPIDPGDAERLCPTPLPRKRQDGEHDWTPELSARLRRRPRPIWLLRDPLFFAARAALRAHGAAGEVIPSTGFLSLFLLRRHQEWRKVRIDVHGFGFAGWDGHAWDAERRWTESEAGRGGLVLHPVPQAP